MTVRFHSFLHRKANSSSLLVTILAVAVVLAVGCSRSPEVREARSLNAGKAYLAKKDYARAILEFNNAIKAMPSHAEPYFQLGMAYLGSGDVSLAAQGFRKAIDRNRDYTAAQLKLAELESMSRNQEAVGDALRRALEVLGRTPDDPDALNVAGLAELRLGQDEAARKHLEQALQKFPSHMKAAVNLARMRLQQNDRVGAESALKGAAAQAPNSTEPLTALGEFYIAIGKPAEAEQQFHRVQSMESNNPIALIRLGQLQWRAQRLDEAEQTYRKLSLLPDRRYKQVHAAFLLAVGKTDLAIVELEILLKASPDDRAVRTALVNAYMAANRTSDAEKTLATALQRWPEDTDALLQRSRIYVSRGRYREAEADLTRVLSFQPTSAEAHYFRSKLHQALGETANRQHELGEALRYASNEGNDGIQASARIELAQMLIESKGAKSALALLDEAPTNQKSALPFAIQRIWAWLALDDKTRARQEIDRILAASRVPEVVLQDGVLRLADRDATGARNDAEEVLRQRPDEVRALNVLIQAYYAQKQLDVGIQKLREYAQKAPQSVAVQRFVAGVLANNGSRPEARQILDAAKTLNSSTVGIYLDLADIDISEGKLETARKYLSSLLQSDTHDGAVRAKLAAVEMAGGNYAAAIKHYQKMVEIDPRNTLALNNLAYLLSDFQQQPDQALKYAQKAKELSPDSAAADDTLGWIYYHKALYSLAVRHLESAVSKEPNARRQYHLAMAYLKQGERAKGKQVLDAALRVDPSLPEAVSAKKVLTEVSQAR